MSERAHSSYAGNTAEQRRARDLLPRGGEGFHMLGYECWHFDFSA